MDLTCGTTAAPPGTGLPARVKPMIRERVLGCLMRGPAHLSLMAAATTRVGPLGSLILRTLRARAGGVEVVFARCPPLPTPAAVGQAGGV